MPARIPLADVLNAPGTWTPSDAVAVIVQLAHAPQTGRPRPVPLEPGHVWLERSGAVTLEPGLLPRLGEFAALLDRLLAPFGDNLPRGLRSIVERAMRPVEGTRIPSLTAFAAALEPFQATEPAAAVRDLVTKVVDRGGAATAPVVAAIVRPSPVPPTAALPTATKPHVVRAAPAPAMRVTPAPVATSAAPAPVAVPVSVRPAAPVTTQPEPPPLPQSGPMAWRPSTWHIGGAVAATVLASILGGSLARSHRSAALQPSAASAATPRPERPPIPEPELVPSPLVTSTPAVTATVPLSPALVPTSIAATTPLSPALVPTSIATAPAVAPMAPVGVPLAAPTAPAATAEARPQPARLVDRREVQADAVFSPSFASSGSAVFFHAASARGSALKRADVDGGELRVASIVDDGARNYHVQLSPDGTHVAFDSDRDGVRGVYVADANGRGVRRISGPGHAAVPTWSPDGRQLAFIRAERERPAVWNLWLHDRNTGRETRVTGFRRGQVWGGAWFADGRRIAYSHEDQLTILDLETGRRRIVASPVAGRLVRTPAVSPDGRWIVFQVFRDGVWLYDVEAGAMRRVLDDPSAEEFAWSPDGRRVAYHSRRSGGWNLWTMAAPGN
jgi:Tol biopolymer transport system component